MTAAKDLKQQPWKFSIGDQTQGIFRKLTEGISTRIFSGKNVMLSVVKLEPNTAGTVHSHPEEQWGVLLEGACVRIQGDEELTMKEGDFWYTPCGISHGIRTGETGATVLDVFSPPRNEYKKQGEGFSSSTLSNVKG